jgi:hypothetical protein
MLRWLAVIGSAVFLTGCGGGSAGSSLSGGSSCQDWNTASENAQYAYLKTLSAADLQTMGGSSSIDEGDYSSLSSLCQPNPGEGLGNATAQADGQS